MIPTSEFFTDDFFKATMPTTNTNEQPIASTKEAILCDLAKQFLKENEYPDNQDTVQALLNEAPQALGIGIKPHSHSSELPDVQKFISFVKNKSHTQFVNPFFDNLIDRLLEKYPLPETFELQQTQAVEKLLNTIGTDEAFKIENLYDENNCKLPKQGLKFQLKLTLFNRMQSKGWIHRSTQIIPINNNDNNAIIHLNSIPGFSWVTDSTDRRIKFTQWIKENQAYLIQNNMLRPIINGCLQQGYNTFQSKNHFSKLEKIILDIAQLQAKASHLKSFVDGYKQQLKQILTSDRLGHYINYLIDDKYDENRIQTSFKAYSDLFNPFVDLNQLPKYLNQLKDSPNKLNTMLNKIIGKDRLENHMRVAKHWRPLSKLSTDEKTAFANSLGRNWLKQLKESHQYQLNKTHLILGAAITATVLGITAGIIGIPIFAITGCVAAFCVCTALGVSSVYIGIASGSLVFSPNGLLGKNGAIAHSKTAIRTINEMDQALNAKSFFQPMSSYPCSGPGNNTLEHTLG